MVTIDALNFQWTIIAAAIILFLGMGGFSGLIIWAVRTGMKSVHSDLRADIAEVKGEIARVEAGLKVDIADLRGELKVDIADLRGELKGDIARVEAELKGDIARVEAELKGDIARVEAELKGDIARLKADINQIDETVAGNRFEILTNRRLLARFALHRHGDDGLPLAPLTDSLEPPEGSGGRGEAND